MWRVLAVLMVIYILADVLVPRAHARDPGGKYAAANPELHQWFESLKSGKGFCCADADGVSLSDVEVQTENGHYKVFVAGEWVDVPPEAVLTVPNRVGKTMVWPHYNDGHAVIRCFLPGAMI